MRPSFARGTCQLPSPGAQARPSSRSAHSSIRRNCVPEEQENVPISSDAECSSVRPTPPLSGDSDRAASSSTRSDIWHEYASHLDSQQRRLEILRESRDSAAAEQDFFAAAAFAQQAEDLESSDSLKRLRQAQADAIAEQDFAKAAQIYQARLGALCGWWHVSPGQADAWGHVLHVTESFGKLTGTAYSAADLVKVFGCTPDNQMRANLDHALLNRVGAPVFEVYVNSPDDPGAHLAAVTSTRCHLRLALTHHPPHCTRCTQHSRMPCDRPGLVAPAATCIVPMDTTWISLRARPVASPSVRMQTWECSNSPSSSEEMCQLWATFPTRFGRTSLPGSRRRCPPRGRCAHAPASGRPASTANPTTTPRPHRAAAVRRRRGWGPPAAR